MDNIEFLNRQSNNANRRKLKIISQNANEILADIEFADNATVEGTALTAQILNNWQTQINTNETICNQAKTIAEQSEINSNSAIVTANTANSNSQTAVNTATEAKETANNANLKAEDALERAINGLGTKITFNGEVLSTWDHSTKLNVTDVVDNLSSESTNVPLSANQGRLLKSYMDNLWSIIYPIGSIYISLKNTNPKDLFGGEWVPLPSGYTFWTIPTSEVELSEGDGLGGGKTINAGLPNITGELNCYANNDSDHELGSCSGAISGKSSEKNYSDNTRNVNSNAFAGFYLNANWSNSIYGNSATVQPPAIKIYAWERRL